MAFDVKQKKIKIIILFLVVILLLVSVLTFVFKGAPKKMVAIPCPPDTKICDDGSAVGRTGPKCEFLACPVPVDNDYRKNFIDDKAGVEFKYYQSFPANYISAVEWPPKVEVTEGKNTCVETVGANNEISRSVKHSENNITYCVETKSGAAAGSVYTDFIYSTVKDGKLVTIKLSLRFVQCDNYNDPEKTVCKDERKFFNLDGIIDSIVTSLKINN